MAEGIFLHNYNNDDVNYGGSDDNLFSVPFTLNNMENFWQETGFQLDDVTCQDLSNTFNPDDFLNDIEKDNALSYIERDTPSPSNSSCSTSSNSNETVASSSPNTTNLEAPIMYKVENHGFTEFHINCSKDNQTSKNSITHDTFGQIPLISLNDISLEPQTISLAIQKSSGNEHNNKQLKRSTIVLPLKDYKALTNNGSLQIGEDQRQRVIIKTIPKSPFPNKDNQYKVNSEQLGKRFFQAAKQLDERAMKRKQRMIKNRKSAILSRQKKREYVESLEAKIVETEKENQNLKNENMTLRSELHNISLLCRCNFKNVRGFNISPNVKKNTVVLLAMVFMVSLNFGNFNFAINNSLMEDELKTAQHSTNRIGRGLLWVNETISENEKLLNSVSANNSNYPVRPVGINQTENMRIANELRNWIGVNRYLNLSLKENDEFSFKLKSAYLPTKPSNNNRKITSRINNFMKKRKVYKNDTVRSSYKRNLNNVENQIQIFNPELNNDKYSKLFKEIRRRDDTFYVVSFNKDLILLSASAHNKTSRPKISFMLPAGDTHGNGKITLMQIDCEVINTSVIRIREEFVPRHLRQSNNYNAPTSKNSTEDLHTEFNVKENLDLVELSIQSYNKKNKLNGFYKPYFVDKNLSKSSKINN